MHFQHWCRFATAWLHAWCPWWSRRETEWWEKTQKLWEIPRKLEIFISCGGVQYWQEWASLCVPPTHSCVTLEEPCMRHHIFHGWCNCFGSRGKVQSTRQPCSEGCEDLDSSIQHWTYLQPSTLVDKDCPKVGSSSGPIRGQRDLWLGFNGWVWSIADQSVPYWEPKLTGLMTC
jgi:hypothetical protein